MKRTLLEILCGLAVLVLLASFHHQIARLKVHSKEVHELRALVENTAEQASSKADFQGLRQQLLERFDSRVQDLERSLAAAAAGTEETQKLKSEVERARSEVARFRDEIGRDVTRTKDLVDAYMDEMRTAGRHADVRLSETESALESLRGEILPDAGVLTRSMLTPTVQLNGDDTVGSGTLVFSGRNPRTEEVESYVLTSYHVVRNILADTPRARKEGFDVSIYLPDGKLDVKGSMVAHNARIDAALVVLQTDRVFANVARVMPRAAEGTVRVWDPVCAVGCPLGNDPVPTNGEISSLHNELNGANYWMINAPTYFGNSGGGIYLAKSRELIGVFSKIYTHGKANPVVVPHMGLCTPIDAIYEWLEEQGMAHLLDPTLQVEQITEAEAAEVAAPGK